MKSTIMAKRDDQADIHEVQVKILISMEITETFLDELTNLRRKVGLKLRRTSTKSLEYL